MRQKEEKDIKKIIEIKEIKINIKQKQRDNRRQTETIR